MVIAGMGEGLQNSDIAKVTDIVMEETGLTADKIKIMEEIKVVFLRPMMVQYIQILFEGRAQLWAIPEGICGLSG